MKKYLLLLFLLIAKNSSSQQSGFFASVGGETNFQIDTTRDGGYIVNSITGYNTNGDNFIIFKLDSAGNTQWYFTNNQFDGVDSNNYLHSIKQIDDGGIIGVGYINNPSAINVEDDLVVKLDASGNLLFKKRINHTIAEELTCIYDNHDSTLLLGGYQVVAGGTAAGGSNVLIKMKYSGDTLWSRKIPFAFANGNDLFKIHRLNSNYYLFGATVDSIANFMVYRSEVIIKTDSIGNHIWTKHINDTSIFYGDYSTRLTFDSTFLSYAAMKGPSGRFYSRINRYDLQGNLTQTYFTDIYGRLDGDSTVVGMWAVQASDSSMVGRQNFLNGIKNEYSYCYVAPPFHFSNINDFISDHKKNILFCGSISFSSFKAGFVAKYSDTLVVGINSLSNKNIVVNTYPNPTAGNINLNIEGDFSKFNSYYVSLYNSLGELLIERKNISDTFIRLDLSGLAQGIYYYWISDNKTTIYKGKIIINRN